MRPAVKIFLMSENISFEGPKYIIIIVIIIIIIIISCTVIDVNLRFTNLN